MSAYIVSRQHIAFLVTAAIVASESRVNYHSFSFYSRTRSERVTLRSGDRKLAAELANMLWRENIASVSHRYPNESSATLPGPVGENFVFTESDFRARAGAPAPVAVFKSIRCFEYQSCEHPGWRDSDACAFCESLVDAYIERLPGYEAASWGAPGE